MDSLEHVARCIRYNDVTVGGFYMVTNGKAINIERVAQWAADMHEVCDNNECSGIGFSFDTFHKSSFNWEQSQKQERNYVRLSEKIQDEYGIEHACSGRFVTKHTDNSFGYDSLLSEGRAADFGVRKNLQELFSEDTYGKNVSFNDCALYLSSNGRIVAGCNWSYHRIDNDKKIYIAHIDEISCKEDLIAAIRAYNEKNEVNLLQTA
jgi:hypothetical protein